MADSLSSRRKKQMKPKKMMDAYGGKDMDMDEMTAMAKSMAPAKPSIRQTARKRRLALLKGK